MDDLAKQQDPDLEVILSLLQGAVVPAITVLSVLANAAQISQAVSQRKREQQEDLRAARQIVLRMQGALDEAEILLRWANDFLHEHNFAHVQVWPVGINGVRLTEAALARYLETVDRCCALIRRVDRDGMELSGYAQDLREVHLLEPAALAQWQRDLHQTKLMQESVLKAHTFGEKTRLLKISIRMCRGVLEPFQQALNHPYIPPVTPRKPWGHA